LSEHDAKKSYLDKVCSAVRWKQAHEAIRRELSDHIEDQADAFEAQGMEPDEAMNKAVLEMGDAEEVGYGLDASYRPREVKGIAIPIAGLVLIGMICRIWVTNTPVDAKYIAAIIMGAICAFALYNVNLYKFAKYSGAVFIGGLAICFGLHLMALYGYYSFRFNNPIVYYAACFSPALYAGLVYSMRNTGIKGLLLCGAAAGALCLLVLMIPSWTGILSVVVSYLIILTAAISLGIFGPKRSMNYVYLVIIYGGVLAIGIIALCSFSDFMRYRLTMMLNPETDWLGSIIKGVVTNAKFIGASDFIAHSMDQSEMLGFFHDTRWDYLITLILYKYGWLSVIALLLVIGNFLLDGFRRAFKLNSTLGKLLACGIMSAYTMQTLSYVVSNLGIFICAPLPLPFIAHGNTALVINLAMAGMLLSLLRKDGLYTDTPSGKAKRLRIRFEWE